MSFLKRKRLFFVVGGGTKRFVFGGDKKGGAFSVGFAFFLPVCDPRTLNLGIIWPLGAPAAPPGASNPKMRRSSTDETPYRRSPSLDSNSKAGSPPLRYSGEYEYRSSPFTFGFRTTQAPPGGAQGAGKGRYGTSGAGGAAAQGRKYVVFYLDLSFIFLLELRRCRMAEGCMRALRYGMVFFNLLFWVSTGLSAAWVCVCV